MRVVLISAEASGHRLGQALATELDATHLRLDLAAVGPVETLGLVPRALRTVRDVEATVLAMGADRVLTIDAPTLNLRLAARLRRRGIQVLHWVSPQIWAWRGYRRHRIARSVDALGCLLPFEPALYRDTGLHAVFTGHPGARAPRSPRPEALGIAAGSRTAERRRLGPIFAAAARELDLPVVEAVPPGEQPVLPGARVVPDVPTLAQQVSVALVCSGTATLELAAAGVPMVAAYAMHPASWAIARRFVHLDSAILPNLVLGRRWVPECLQDVSSSALLAHLDPLLGPRGDRTADALREVGGLLHGEHAIANMACLVRR